MSENVHIKYDPQVDILRIRFGDTVIHDSDEVSPGVIVDYDEDGKIVGLELMDISDTVQPAKAAALHIEK